jgi:hypothetical protein
MRNDQHEEPQAVWGRIGRRWSGDVHRGVAQHRYVAVFPALRHPHLHL